jgi:hypothetical protein
MKNFKRILGFTAIMAVMFALGSCILNVPEDSHTHTWGQWRSNASQHWRECSDCGEESARESHSGTSNCTVCGYQTMTYSLNGVWSRGPGELVSISGSSGYVTQLGTFSAYPTIQQSAINRGYYSRNDQFFRYLSNSSGGRTWTGDIITFLFYTNSPNVCIGTSFTSCTITLNSDGQSFVVSGSKVTTQTFTKQ